MQVVVDRFEGEYAVVELPDGTIVNFPKVLLPNAKEGDVVEIRINKSQTEQRRKENAKLSEEVWEK